MTGQATRVSPCTIQSKQGTGMTITTVFTHNKKLESDPDFFDPDFFIGRSGRVDLNKPNMLGYSS